MCSSACFQHKGKHGGNNGSNHLILLLCTHRHDESAHSIITHFGEKVTIRRGRQSPCPWMCGTMLSVRSFVCPPSRFISNKWAHEYARQMEKRVRLFCSKRTFAVVTSLLPGIPYFRISCWWSDIVFEWGKKNKTTASPCFKKVRQMRCTSAANVFFLLIPLDTCWWEGWMEEEACNESLAHVHLLPLRCWKSCFVLLVLCFRHWRSSALLHGWSILLSFTHLLLKAFLPLCSYHTSSCSLIFFVPAFIWIFAHLL